MKEQELKIEKTKEEKLKEEYIKYRLLRDRLTTLLSQKSLLEKNMESLKETIETIKSISRVKIPTEIFASLGNDAYIKVDLKDNKNILVNIVAGIILEKSIEDALKIFEAKIEDLKKLIEEINKQVEIFEKEIDLSEKRIIEISKK